MSVYPGGRGIENRGAVGQCSSSGVRSVRNCDSKTVGEGFKLLFEKMPKKTRSDGMPIFYENIGRQFKLKVDKDLRQLKSRNNELLEYITKARISGITPEIIENIKEKRSKVTGIVTDILNENDIGFSNSQAENVLKEVFHESYIFDMQILSLLAEYSEHKDCDYDLLVSTIIELLLAKKIHLLESEEKSSYRRLGVKYSRDAWSIHHRDIYLSYDSAYRNCVRYLFRIVQDHQDRIHLINNNPARQNAAQKNVEKKYLVDEMAADGMSVEEVAVDEQMYKIDELMKAIANNMEFSFNYPDEELNKMLSEYVSSQGERLLNSLRAEVDRVFKINAKSWREKFVSLLDEYTGYSDEYKKYIGQLGEMINDLGFASGATCNVSRAINTIPDMYKACRFDDDFRQAVKICLDDLTKLASDKKKRSFNIKHPFVWLSREEIGLTIQILHFLLEGESVPHRDVVNPDLYYYVSAVLFFAADDSKKALDFAEKSHLAESVWLQGYLHEKKGAKLESLDKYNESLRLGCVYAESSIDDIEAVIAREKEAKEKKARKKERKKIKTIGKIKEEGAVVVEGRELKKNITVPKELDLSSMDEKNSQKSTKKSSEKEWWDTPRYSKSNSAENNQVKRRNRGKSAKKSKQEVSIVAKEKAEAGKKIQRNLVGLLEEEKECLQNSASGYETTIQSFEENVTQDASVSDESDTSADSGFQKVTAKVPVMSDDFFTVVMNGINSEVNDGKYESTWKDLCAVATRTKDAIHQAHIAQVNLYRLYLLARDEKFLDDFLEGKIKRIPLHLKNATLYSTSNYYTLSEEERAGTVSKEDAIRRLQCKIGKEILKQAAGWQPLLHSPDRADKLLANQKAWLDNPMGPVEHLLKKEEETNKIISNQLASASASLLATGSHVHSNLNPRNLTDEHKNNLKGAWADAADLLNPGRKFVRMGKGQHEVFKRDVQLKRQFGMQEGERLRVLPPDEGDDSYTHIGAPIAVSNRLSYPPR